MPRNYVPIFILIVIAMAIPIVTLAFGWLLRPSKPEPAKLMPYECGITPFDNARQRYTIRFYIVAIQTPVSRWESPSRSQSI
jgi:NADH-quinone oxidoreductase subunit A